MARKTPHGGSEKDDRERTERIALRLARRYATEGEAALTPQRMPRKVWLRVEARARELIREGRR